MTTFCMHVQGRKERTKAAHISLADRVAAHTGTGTAHNLDRDPSANCRNSVGLRYLRTTSHQSFADSEALHTEGLILGIQT